MTAMRHWTVDIVIDELEHERTTRAEARLRVGDEAHVFGHGTAYRHPDDQDVPRIGDELAAARALSELSHRLVLAAAEDIEQSTHQQARLRG
jgi:hypothetical protein